MDEVGEEGRECLEFEFYNFTQLVQAVDQGQ